MHDLRDRFCIIGAGSSGLTGAKNLKAWGIPFDLLEQEQDVGGLWCYGSKASRVFRTTHLVSSKRMTGYTDYRMPDHYPDFPSHWQAQDYLRSYAHHFGLYPSIRFGARVARAERVPEDGSWTVTVSDGESSRYGGLVVANGHNWKPRFVHYPGEFDGRILHSAEYRTSELLRDRRVVVVGAGNSGCDIACEAAQVAHRAIHSVRRGYHFVPKYMFGRPSDEIQELFLRLRVPLWLRRPVATLWIRLFSHDASRYGYPKPDHRLWETHLVLNSQIIHYASHGDIVAKPDIRGYDGDGVVFADGSREEKVDLVVLATGYELDFPFLDQRFLNWQGGRPELHLNMLHPQYDNLFVLGLMQPSGGQWQLVDYQAQLMARLIIAGRQMPSRRRRLQQFKNERPPDLSGGIRYVRSPRHAVELEHSTYRRRLQRLSRTLEGGMGRKPLSPLLPLEPLKPFATRVGSRPKEISCVQDHRGR